MAKKARTALQEVNYRIVDGEKVCDVREPTVKGKVGQVVHTAVRPGKWG